MSWLSTSASSSDICAESVDRGDMLGDEKGVNTIHDTGKRSDYLSWEEYFMAVAHLAAQRSKDPCTQVGAVIVNSQKKIVAVGYNGMPNRCSDNELPWIKSSNNPLENKFMYVCHAELNAVLNKNCESLNDSVMYTVLFPCNECAKLIIQTGIREVVFTRDKPNKVEMKAAKRMFDMAGVKYRLFTSKRFVTIDLSNGNTNIVRP
ncbi:hypothetical protein AB6A40_005992 [Gnathostoma spinigerum]|uniref:Probable deoxycytidylate deaminase n=1 Tax=Gnathostoma spinigerum TaxID=75299 RepID=A0ABD6EH24_9BILA